MIYIYIHGLKSVTQNQLQSASKAAFPRKSQSKPLPKKNKKPPMPKRLSHNIRLFLVVSGDLSGASSGGCSIIKHLKIWRN